MNPFTKRLNPYTSEAIAITTPKLVLDMPYSAVRPGMAIEKFFLTK